MATGKLAAVPEPADDEFRTMTLKARGKTYSFRELSTDQYDKLIKMATDEDDLVDRTLLLRLMAAESSVEPRLTPEMMKKMPYPIARRIGALVNDMHFFDGDEADEDEGPNVQQPPKS